MSFANVFSKFTWNALHHVVTVQCLQQKTGGPNWAASDGMVFLENPHNGMPSWVHHSWSDSNYNLWRLWLPQRLLWLRGLIGICFASIQGGGHSRRAEGYVPEPGGGRQIGSDAERKAVDFSTLHCVAGVVLVSLVPGQNASFMLWSYWTRVKRVKSYC